MLVAVLAVGFVSGTGTLPVNAEEPAATYTGGLCEHHTAHDEECGYQEAVEGSPCTHEHTDDCYTLECKHKEHDEACGFTEDGGECSHEHTEACYIVNCSHTHDEACGYQEEVEGNPCGYVCEICSAGTVSGDPTESETECICEILCTEGNVNTDCPVCSAAQADLDQCTGAEKKEAPVCNCTEKCTEGNVNTDCPVCGADGADLGECTGNEQEDKVKQVQAMIDALPTAEELAAMTQGEQGSVYADLQAAYDAYEALTDEQKAEITGAEIFDALFAVFSGMVNELDAAGVTYIAYTWDEDSKTLTQTSEIATTYTTIDANMTKWNGSTTNGVYVAEGSVNIDIAQVIVSGDVKLILKDKATLSCSGGISVAQGGTLSIYAQSTDEKTMGSVNASGGNSSNVAGIVVGVSGTINIHGGKVTATGSYNSAGIGGGNGATGGTTSIYGGIVTTTGGYNGAGIGGGNGASGGTISIYGGIVTTTGGFGGAGIGGGIRASGGTTSIYGGTVKATSNEGGGSGIGCGYMGSGGTITISGGEVTATGSTNSSGIGGINCTITISGESTQITAQGGRSGAGIGSGSGDAGTITISGGKVDATGGSGAAGIGGGENDSGGIITISGGVVTAKGGAGGAGIGGGQWSGTNTTIDITGGTVTVTGGGGNGKNAADIGGGHSSNGTLASNSITIGEGATVKDANGNAPYIGPYHGADMKTWKSDAKDHWHPCMIETCSNTDHQADKASHSYSYDFIYENYTLVPSCPICTHVDSAYNLDSITVVNQPLKLTYNGGDQLDLSGLTIEAIFCKGTESKTLTLDYDSTGVTCSPVHGTVLNADHNGKSITITFGGKTTTTNQLSVPTPTPEPTPTETSKPELAGAPNPHTHSYISFRMKAATCTEAGTLTHTCSCGQGYSEEIPALGHNYTGSITKQPTVTSEGVMTYTCTRCGDTYTKPIEKLKPQEPTETPKPGPGVPFIRDDDGKESWEVIRDGLKELVEKVRNGETTLGETVTVDMNGSTTVPAEIFEIIAGEDITVVFDLGGGITWTVNGKSVTGTDIGDIDFGVTRGTGTIPVDVINNVTGERYSINITLAYEGEFGFTAILTINLDQKNAGLYANLFYYHAVENELEYLCADQIDGEGNAELTFTHASDYTIVIDAEPMEPEGAEDTEEPTDEGTIQETAQTNADDQRMVEAPQSGETARWWWILLIVCIIAAAGIGGYVYFVGKKKGR